jgi:hypothetical protein
MSILTDARAEALFASLHDPSEPMTAVEAKAAVREAVKRLGVKGCAQSVAFEFGDHPEIALARMLWAREKVAATWPGAR